MSDTEADYGWGEWDDMTTATKPKWTKADGSVRKTIYHSYFVREGRLMIKLLGDPYESKFKQGQMVVSFQVPDEDTHYTLQIEPECVESVVNAPKDTWLYVQAIGGGPEDDKFMHFSDGVGPVFDDSTHVEPEDAPQPQSGPPPMFPDDAPTAQPTQAYTTTANGKMAAAWAEAVTLITGLYPDAAPEVVIEAASRMANTMFIQASR